MNQINISTGQVTYTINGNCEISFNPADADFAGRVLAAFEKCSEICSNTTVDPQSGVSALMETARKIDTEIRKEIDDLFGEPVCDKIFGRVNAISLAAGLPVWANFLMAVIDEMDKAITEAKKQANPRVRQYIQKYEKKYAKK